MKENISNDNKIILNIDDIYVDLAFKKVRLSKTPGPNDIGYALLLLIYQSNKDIFVDMINDELNNESVIDEFRYADIYPLHKNGDLSDPNNFRPVSCGNCLFKIIESIFMKVINIDRY